MKFYEKFVNYLEKCNLTDEQYNNIMDLYHDINLDKLLEFEDYLDESVNNNVYDYESLYDKLSTLSNYYSFVMKVENEKEDVIDIDEDSVKITSADEVQEETNEHNVLFDKITDVDEGILSKYYEGSLRDEYLNNRSADNYGKLYELLLKIVQCLNLNNDECLILLNTAAISKHLYNSKNYYLPADINKYLYANSQAQQLIREADKLNLSSKYWADLIEHLKRL